MACCGWGIFDCDAIKRLYLMRCGNLSRDGVKAMGFRR
jgi:hypothetical protein